VDAQGVPVPVERVDKRTWRVAADGRAVTLRYRVYANELTVRTSHLDGSHGYFNGATLFLYAEPLRGVRHLLTVEAPAGWSVFTALEPEGEGFSAPDYDTLIDSPVEIGPHTPIRFQAAGVPHQVVVWGGTLDPAKVEQDFRAVVEAEAALWGG